MVCKGFSSSLITVLQYKADFLKATFVQVFLLFPATKFVARHRENNPREMSRDFSHSAQITVSPFARASYGSL